MAEAKQAEIDALIEGVEMVTINDGSLPGMEVQIPRELHDKALLRYAKVLEKNALAGEIKTLDTEITGLMHRFAPILPTKAVTDEVYFQVPDADGQKIETILEKTETEKLHTKKVKEDE